MSESAIKKEGKIIGNDKNIVTKLGKGVWNILTGIVISIIATAATSAIVSVARSQMNSKGDAEMGRNMKCLEHYLLVFIRRIA